MLKNRECIFLDFVAVAALKNPRILPGGVMSERDTDVTREKIRSIFRLAYHTRHRDVLLGALGCGAYNNPPAQIAALFKEVMAEEEFSGLFDHVDFAILDGSRDGNHPVFTRILTNQ